MNFAEIATNYAERVVSGEVLAGKFTILACKRHLKDLKKSAKPGFKFYFDPPAVERVCRFMELLPHVKGKWARDRSKIKLEPWQIFILASIFGWKKKSNGLRRFREAYIEVARKNGKSILSAGIGLYMLVADNEPGAEVFCGATTQAQAMEVFRPAKLMVEKSPALQQKFGVVTFASNLHVPSTGARFEPVTGKPGDGSSPHCAIVDEYHEHKGPEQYDTFITGMGAREQPLLLVITTAGTDLSSPCYDKRGQVAKVLEGTFDNDELFGVIYTLDKDDDWTDLEVWPKANPNFGVSVFQDFLSARHLEATQRASRQNIIRCKHLDQWMNAGSAFIDLVSWEKAATDLTLDDFEGEDCWMGLDLSSKIDLTALVMVFRREGNFYSFPIFWLPEAATQATDKVFYAAWAEEGHLRLCGESRINQDDIEEEIIALAKRFRIRAVGHDPWNSAQLVSHLLNENIPMVEVRQSVQSLSDPMKELEAHLLDGTIKHDRNPVQTWMASNLVAFRDKKDNVFPRKERDENKIDGMVALIMALGQALADVEETSVYETRGVRVI